MPHKQRLLPTEPRPGTRLSVRDAVRSYLADRAAEGQDTAGAAQQLRAHVLPRWGHRLIAELNAPELKQWRDELAAAAPRRRRSKRFDPQPSACVDPRDAEQRRKRRATVNRICTTFKATLNHIARFYPDLYVNAAPWRVGLKAFRNVEAARDRWLQTEEIARLLPACPPDFRRLVRAALYTGCRYGELCRALVGDYDATRACLRIPITKSGRSRDVFLNDEGGEFFAAIAAERTADRRLLTRTTDRGTTIPWGPSHQARRIRRACQAAKISPPISFHDDVPIRGVRVVSPGSVGLVLS